MAWSTLRRATEDDYEALEAIAARFAMRHNIEIADNENETALQAVEFRVGFEADQSRGYPGGNRLEKLWLRCIRRKFGQGVDGISGGYIGSHVD